MTSGAVQESPRRARREGRSGTSGIAPENLEFGPLHVNLDQRGGRREIEHPVHVSAPMVCSSRAPPVWIVPNSAR